MKQVTDLTAIEKVVDDIIAKNPDKVEQAKAKPALIGWFVGQVMKASGGKANPQAVNDLLKSKLGNLKTDDGKRRARQFLLVGPSLRVVCPSSVVPAVAASPANHFAAIRSNSRQFRRSATRLPGSSPKNFCTSPLRMLNASSRQLFAIARATRACRILRAIAKKIEVSKTHILSMFLQCVLKTPA